MSDETIRLTRAQVREVDRRATEEFGLPGVVLMENAAINASAVALEMVDYESAGVIIVCGGGNNGGDGLAIARHLDNFGTDVRVVLTVDPAKHGGDAAINWRVVERMGINVVPWTSGIMKEGEPELIIDAVFGTGLSQAPREPFAAVAREMNISGVPILAIDVPSGLDCDTGEPLGPVCVKATQTVTFVAEKVGFANVTAREFTGTVVVAGIGCPAEIVEEVLGGT
jgi:NAD(P)H-hydrate epimerase